MPLVWVPPALRDLTAGRDQVVVGGSTLRQVINALEEQFPGFKKRLVDGDRLNPSMSVAIDGATISMGLLEPVDEDSEITFIPAIRGGKG